MRRPCPIVTLRGVSRVHRSGPVAKTVLRGVSLSLPRGRSIALLGRNGAGKTSLMALLSGADRPDSGRIERFGRVSWPVGFAGSFHPDLTGRENLAFVGRLYGAELRALSDFVSDFSELGRDMDKPLRHYSSGMRSRLAFGLSMALPFDLYLADEITAVGDARFRERSERLLADRARRAGAVVVSHAMGQIRSLCDCGMVLEAGRLTWHDEVEAAIAHHRRLMQVAV